MTMTSGGVRSAAALRVMEVEVSGSKRTRGRSGGQAVRISERGASSAES